MATRMKDVAELAAVSIKTVSNVVNGTGYVSDDMRTRVQTAIHALGYQPNAVARSLRSGRSGIIALAVPEISSPYFGELAHRLTLAAELQDISVVTYPTNVTPSRERLAANGLNNALIDGVILSPLALGNTALRHVRPKVPVVLLGEQVTASKFDHVAIDNVTASREAVGHLLNVGRRRIGAVGIQENRDIGTSRDRLKGYRDAHRDAGRRTSGKLEALVSLYHRRDGYQAAMDLMDANAELDALFCFNDLLAVGAAMAIQDRGRRIPDDVAIVGFDGTEDAEYSRPPLSTVAPDIQFIAETALDILARRVAGKDWAPQEVRAPFELRLRESSIGRSEDGGRP